MKPEEVAMQNPHAGSASNQDSRLERARRLYRDFYVSCFWHLKPDLAITEELIPLIIRGLRTHGGRPGLLAAAELADAEASSQSCP
jgi:hypothetical protein